MNLDFNQLRVANVDRCNESFHRNGSIADWTPTDWATALAGECGEACNLIKKMRRLATAPECQSAMHPEDRRGYADLVQAVGEELADLVIYADLLAARLGINLGESVVRKFNEVSAKVGSVHRMATESAEGSNENKE